MEPRPRKRRRDAAASPTVGASLHALLNRLRITDWDFLVVGDGSGSTWGFPAGWAAVSVANRTFARKVWWGAVSDGTVNFAEIMAYMQFLTWLGAREDDRRAAGKRRRVVHVHIITDSQYVSNTGAKTTRFDVKKNSVLWAAFDVLARQGIVLHWHWLARETTELNSYVDKLSKLARGRLKARNLQKRLDTQLGKTAYQHNSAQEI